MTGGGSGGHITPILAIATELKRLQPNLNLVYIGQKGDGLSDIPSGHSSIDKVYEIRAGKLRRYHGEGLRQLLDVKTLAFNIRDLFFVLIGLCQSFWLLRRLKPELVFIKGGFVGVPIGLNAALLHIPYVTHDSDALPGLANRIIARWASLHAVGQPKEIYSYPADKTITVGVPVQAEFKPVTADLVKKYRRELGLEKYQQVICVAGGGLGAHRVNQALLAIAPSLLTEFPDLALVHQAGRKHEKELAEDYQKVLTPEQAKRVIVKGFVTDMYRLSGAADLVISRAGATNMAEFAIQAKPCIIIPNPALTGGHQSKNAKVLADKDAIDLLTEAQLMKDPTSLLDMISGVLKDNSHRQILSKNISGLAHPDSAKQLAEILLDTANGGSKDVEA